MADYEENRPILFNVTEVTAPAPREPQERPHGPGIRIVDPSRFQMAFGPTTTKDIDELRVHMRADNASREDVVFTALQILALSRSAEVEVESPNNFQRRRVNGLWKDASS